MWNNDSAVAWYVPVFDLIFRMHIEATPPQVARLLPLIGIIYTIEIIILTQYYPQLWYYIDGVKYVCNSFISARVALNFCLFILK